MDEPTSQVKTLGRYQLHGELGRGAMGVVYKAFDPVIGRTVALKTLTFDTSGEETEALRQRLHREACAAGTLAHQNIVTVYDVIEEGGTTAIAMEYIEGQTLSDVIDQRAPLPLDAALDIFEPMCAGIDFAGSQGIIHRDIKPANIMLTSDNRVKVADFGVARIEASTMTQTGLIMGSPSYMSPEQVRALPLDSRSDLFSAAVVLYELLTKERPFVGDDVATTMYRIVHEQPVPPSQFNVAIGDRVAAVLHRALGKAPDERFRSGAELCAELRRAVSGAEMPLPPPPVSQATPRFSPLVLGSAGLGVLLLALVGLLAGGDSGETPAPVETVQSGQAQAPVQTSAPPPVAQAPVDAVPAAAVPAAVPAEVAPQPSMPVSTIPPRSGARPATSEPGARPASSTAAAPEEPEPEPEPEPAAPAVPPGKLILTFAGAPYAVSLRADGDRLGIVSRGGGSVDVSPGSHRVRAVGSAVFLSQDFGEMTFTSGGEQTLRMPTTASAFVGVLGDSYDGLQMTISGAAVPGPYPAQIPKITLGRHAVSFNWSTGGLSGLEIEDVIDLRSTGHYLVRAVPQTSQVTVRKLR